MKQIILLLFFITPLISYGLYESDMRRLSRDAIKYENQAWESKIKATALDQKARIQAMKESNRRERIRAYNNKQNCINTNNYRRQTYLSCKKNGGECIEPAYLICE